MIRFNHGFYRNQTNINSENALKKLGADFLEFTPNWHIVKNLMLESFKEKEIFAGIVIQEFIRFQLELS